MILMETNKKVYTFEYNGASYTMAEDEIEAAYRYREHQYRLMDAKCQLCILVFGVDDDGILTDEEVEVAKRSFEKQHGITFKTAAEPDMLEKYLRLYECRFNCGQSENDQWEAAIEAVLARMKKGDR